MAIYTNLSAQNQDQAADKEGDDIREKVDPQLMAAIDLEIQKVKDSKFKDIQKEGLAQDSKFKDEDIKKETHGISSRRKTTKKSTDPDSE